jgi:hypothetical protein
MSSFYSEKYIPCVERMALDEKPYPLNVNFI